jgi:hypothetical protein
MFRLRKSLNSLLLLSLLLIPFVTFSDGGFHTTCKSYKYYDEQPTKIRTFQLIATGLKVNGKPIANMKTVKTINGISNNRIQRSDMDTIEVSDVVISQDNKSITKVQMQSNEGMQFYFIK